MDRLRAAWLSTAPKRLAHERRTTDADTVVFAGTSAARIHGIGDLSLVADALRDADRGGDLDTIRLAELLDPATLTRLAELAGMGQAVTHG